MMLQRFIITISVVGCVAALGACSSTGPLTETDPRDPYEQGNRNIFAFNMGVDDVILEPVARGYRSLPDAAQHGITNHARWTSYPSTAVNSTLQGKFENAGLATIHFLINGLTLGFVDLTEDDDDPVREDFGQTLAHWSTPQGPYVMMPFIGPGTARSHGGWLLDSVTNPLGWLGEPTTATVQATSGPVSAVTFRGNNFDTINDVKYNSADPYARTRSVYYQYREGQLRDGDTSEPSAADDAFDAFLNDEDTQ